MTQKGLIHRKTNQPTLSGRLTILCLYPRQMGKTPKRMFLVGHYTLSNVEAPVLEL